MTNPTVGTDKDVLINHLVQKRLDKLSPQTFPTLEALAQYHNVAVIDNYMSFHPDTPREHAETLLAPTVANLWALAKAVHEDRQIAVLDVFSEQEQLDMWDAFVLCTQEYWSFCFHVFGFYLHRNFEGNYQDWSNFSFSPRAKIASLEETLAHEDDEIVAAYYTLYDVTEEQAHEMFGEAKKWLWLCASSRQDRAEGVSAPKPRVDNDMLMLDEMWHLFMIFSDKYWRFCNRYFGAYIHHHPTTVAEKEDFGHQLFANRGKVLQELEEDDRAFYSYVYDKLGPATLLKWTTESEMFA